MPSLSQQEVEQLIAESEADGLGPEQVVASLRRQGYELPRGFVPAQASRPIPRAMDLIPMGAGVLGGIGGAFAGGPVGSAIGAGIGSGGGELAKLQLAQALGFDVPPMGEQLGQAGTSALWGVGTGAVGGAAGKALSSPWGKRALGAVGQFMVKRGTAPLRELAETVDDVGQLVGKTRRAAPAAKPRPRPAPKPAPKAGVTQNKSPVRQRGATKAQLEHRGKDLAERAAARGAVPAEGTRSIAAQMREVATLPGLGMRQRSMVYQAIKDGRGEEAIFEVKQALGL